MSIGIYKFQNLITQEVYIGQSINLEARYQRHKRDWVNGTTNFYKAIQKYGWNNFSYEVIENCLETELNEKEQFWVNYYDSYNNGYNMTLGGSNQHSVSHQKIYELYDNGMSPIQIAKKLKIGTSTVYQSLNSYLPYINQERDLNYTIYQYDLEGNYIQSWNSCKEAGNNLNICASTIGKAISGKRKSAGGFQWNKQKFSKISPLLKTSLPKIVYQYDLKNNFIKSFNSVSEASEIIHGDASAIRRAARQGLSRSAYGYRWSYVYI